MWLRALPYQCPTMAGLWPLTHHVMVIELDATKYLADAEAHRRDRCKDAALQRHGNFVLRFLSEDFDQHLDDVLDVRRLLVRDNELAKKWTPFRPCPGMNAKGPKN